MRLPATTRLLTLLLALWFASVSCLLGCERDALAGLAVEPPPQHHHAMAAAVEQALPNDCCHQEPADDTDDTAPPRSSLMECCYQAPTVAAQKAKPPRSETAEPLAATTPAPQVWAAGNRLLATTFLADASDTYLLRRILRI